MTNNNIIVARVKKAEDDFLRLYFPSRQEPIVEFSMDEFIKFLDKYPDSGLNYSYIEGKLAKKESISLACSIIVDGVVEREYPTLVDVDDSGEKFYILYPNSISTVELSFNDYLALRSVADINNEALRVTKSKLYRLRLSHYKSNFRNRCLTVAYEKANKVVKLLPTKEETVEQGETVRLLSKAELESVLSEDDSNGSTEWVEQYTEKVDVEPVLVDIPYKELIWNMYPGDRITISNSILGAMPHVLLRILDSDLEGKRIIAVCKIFKQVRTKCTWALLDIRSDEAICSVQVIGQSDIPSKSLPYKSIDDFYIKYADWLSSSKFIRR